MSGGGGTYSVDEQCRQGEHEALHLCDTRWWLRVGSVFVSWTGGLVRVGMVDDDCKSKFDGLEYEEDVVVGRKGRGTSSMFALGLL